EVRHLLSEIRNSKSAIRISRAVLLFGFPLQEDVGRLQIAVNDAALMRAVHGSGERCHELGSGARRLWPACEVVSEAAPVEELHRDIGETGVLANIANSDAVR